MQLPLSYHYNTVFFWWCYYADTTTIAKFLLRQSLGCLNCSYASVSGEDAYIVDSKPVCTLGCTVLPAIITFITTCITTFITLIQNKQELWCYSPYSRTHIPSTYISKHFIFLKEKVWAMLQKNPKPYASKYSSGMTIFRVSYIDVSWMLYIQISAIS